MVDSAMPGWVLLWIARIASGERLRKANSWDYRRQFGLLFTTGLFMLGVFHQWSFLKHGSVVTIWLISTAAICVLYFGTKAWCIVAPAGISLVLALVAWGFFVWMALKRTF
jgi:hypothetical protein